MQIGTKKRFQLRFRNGLEHQHGRLDFLWKRSVDVGLLIPSTTTEVQLQKSPGGTRVYGKRQIQVGKYLKTENERIKTVKNNSYG